MINNTVLRDGADDQISSDKRQSMYNELIADAHKRTNGEFILDQD